ncbi:MAG: GNAT family N-acetyltransferase [Bacillota bacterium]
MTQLFLQGSRICIRDWREDDLPLYERWNRPGHRWQETDGPYFPSFTEEEIRTRVGRLQERIRSGEWSHPRVSGVISLSADAPMVGIVNRYWENEPCNSAYMGVAIYDERLWGKGIGSEALGLWTDYLFRVMAVHRLGLATWSGNVGMVRAALKLGFVEEARLRRARIVRGELYDGLAYGVLWEEWEQLYPQGFGQGRA